MPTINEAYYYSGHHLYLRLYSTYYRRTVGEGWRKIDEPTEVLAEYWRPLTQAHRKALMPALMEANFFQGYFSRLEPVEKAIESQGN